MTERGRAEWAQRSLGLLAILCLLGAAGAGWSQQGERSGLLHLALVSSEKKEPMLQVLALAEARLSELPRIEMLERTAIERVLAEHKLVLSGLVAAEQAVAAGKLLGVDLFAVLDAGAGGKEVGGLVIFEARTGVRLWDAALPGGKLDTSVAGITTAVTAAQAKYRAGRKLRPVCLLTVRNVDLPRDRDALCDSVGLLLERRLAASPDLAVLERRRLREVNRERDLPTGAPLRQLLASVVTLELEISRQGQGKGLEATALLSGGQGQRLGKVSASVDRPDADALSRALLQATLETLHVRTLQAEPDRAREAARFLRETEFYWEHKDPLRALPAAESAYALAPADISLQATVARALLAAANEVLDPGGRRGVGSFVRRVEPGKLEVSDLEQSLALAREGGELLAAVEARADRVELSPAGKVQKMFGESELFEYLKRVGGVTEGLPATAPAAIETIRASQRRLHALRMERSAATVVDEASFDRYTNEVSRSLFPLLSSAVPAEAWLEGLERLRPWAAVARKYDQAALSGSRELLSRAIYSFRFARTLSKPQVERLHRLWSELQEEAGPTVAVYARLGELATQMRPGTLSPPQRQAKVHAYLMDVNGRLDRDPQMPRMLRLNLYLAAMDAVDLIMNLPGYHEELKELTERMLARNELAPSVAQIAAFHFVSQRTLEGYRYAHSVLERALAIVDGKRGRFLTYATTPDMRRHDRDRMRKEYRSREAEIARAVPEAVPELLTTLPDTENLIDIYPNQDGIVWLQQPVVSDGVVHVAAIEMEKDPARYFVRLLRITPGKPGRWQGRRIEVVLRFRPWVESSPTPFRLGVTFGSSACVFGGRYYLGTHGHGILAFPFDESLPERITTAQGLPSNFVQGLAGMDGRLFAYLGEENKDSYLAEWSLGQRRVTVLASSRRKEKRSPFDDSAPLVTSFLQPDAKRGRILFSAFSQFVQDSLNGVWALDVKTMAYKRLFILHHSDLRLASSSARIEGDTLRMPTSIGVFEYDLAANDGRVRYDDRKLEVGPTHSAVYQVSLLPAYRTWTDGSWSAGGPVALAGGWLWAASPFSRRALHGGAPQLLASLREGQSHFTPSECLQKVDSRTLLVGDTFGLWLVPLAGPKPNTQP